MNVLDRSHLSSTAGCREKSPAIDVVAEKRAQEQRGRIRRGSTFASKPSEHIYRIVGRSKDSKSPTWLPRFPMLQPYL
ncbi:hypothetical protein FKP32DRAFT_1597427 [Trametes sanguinea]|nr:hypothetical protein FKP32DRAFT_1597427 [Trametes sanguinea]